jgi:hypothetical protein
MSNKIDSLHTKLSRAFRYTNTNGDHFLIVYDYAAGKRNRYTLFVWRTGKTAQILGREIRLGEAKEIIKRKLNRPGPC